MFPNFVFQTLPTFGAVDRVHSASLVYVLVISLRSDRDTGVGS
jgi:hypothetical protein